MRSLILAPILALAVYALGNALASHHWLAAVPLAVLLIAGIVKLAPSENMQ